MIENINICNNLNLLTQSRTLDVNLTYF